ncbi:hypothetical protein SAV14893_069460 [Streptomyces avermitilis]|uniref:O-acyltransferase WSD1-like N-terminal domain-containing protein n=1 Tax=Streptomyces avermitilis TaxID=33903 RepID=A0A4D4M6Z8_STRAX|nr:hypothetical protein SAV14893_069460 [Streptomyces avermitilis]
MTSDLLAPLDLAFWNIESAQHPMHLGALGVFSCHSPTAGAHAADLLASRAAAVPGLRMRIRDVWQPLAFPLTFPLPFGGATREPAPTSTRSTTYACTRRPPTSTPSRAGSCSAHWSAAGHRGRRMYCPGRTARRSPCSSSSTTRWRTDCGR